MARTCDQPCAAACTSRLIRFYPADHVDAGLPYLTFAETGCNFCGDCRVACPESLPCQPARPVLGCAELDTNRCLAWTGVVCLSCRDRCAERAIEFDARMRPTLSVARCVGCGSCIVVCPLQAISIAPASH